MTYFANASNNVPYLTGLWLRARIRFIHLPLENRNREATIFRAITGFVDLSHLCTKSWHRNAKILKADQLLEMPLYISGLQLISVPSDILKFISTHCDLLSSTELLKATPSQKIGEEGVLYVGQREYAAITPDAENIDVLGADDATTCHILLIKHTGSGVMCLGHLDGCKTKKAIHDMLKKTQLLSYGGPEGRLEVHLVGGFNDGRGISQKLTDKIFSVLINQTEDVHLMTACVSALNDTVRHGVHYPIVYGLGIRVRTGEIFPASFLGKGPDAHIRSAANFTIIDEVTDIFKDGLLTIGPFHWSPSPWLAQYANAPDQVIRSNFSTSPEQEPPYFEEHIRQCFCVLRDHPRPETTLFIGSQSRLYRKNAMKLWTLLDN